jgi:hypothetical protein
MRSRHVVTMLILAALVSVSPDSAAQSPFDSQTLVGEWVGKWTLSVGGGGRAGGREGPYVLTIKRVEGEHVFARVEFQGQSRDIRATLSGNRLAFGNEQFQTALTVEGDQMRGTRQGGGIPSRDITLTKQK